MKMLFAVTALVTMVFGMVGCSAAAEPAPTEGTETVSQDLNLACFNLEKSICKFGSYGWVECPIADAAEVRSACGLQAYPATCCGAPAGDECFGGYGWAEWCGY